VWRRISRNRRAVDVEIVVYTKPRCKLCASFKEKLRDHLKVLFAERDLDRSLRVSDTWREDETDKLAAGHAYLDGAVPFVVIDKVAYKYAAALAEIKRRLTAGEVATMPEPERDKSGDKLGPPLTEEEFVAAAWKLCENHVDLLRIASTVERLYDASHKPVARREVQGRINVWLSYRNPYVKPMALTQIRVVGQDFRDALRNLVEKVEDAKQKGLVYTEDKVLPGYMPSTGS
jgi:hypothetical protein